MTQPRANVPKASQLVYTSLDQVASDVRELFRLMQPRTHRVVAAVPIATDLLEGEIVFYDNESSTRRLYTKLNGSLRYVALT